MKFRITIDSYTKVTGGGGIVIDICPDNEVGENLAEKLGSELPNRLDKVTLNRDSAGMTRKRCTMHVTFSTTSGNKEKVLKDVEEIVKQIVKEEKIDANVSIFKPPF